PGGHGELLRGRVAGHLLPKRRARLGQLPRHPRDGRRPGGRAPLQRRFRLPARLAGAVSLLPAPPLRPAPPARAALVARPGRAAGAGGLPCFRLRSQCEGGCVPMDSLTRSLAIGATLGLVLAAAPLAVTPE